MADDDKLTNREAFITLTGAGLTAAWVVAKVLPSVASNLELQALVDVSLPGFATALGSRLSGMWSSRLPVLTAGYANAFDNDPEKIQAHAKQHEQDPEFHETMYRAFRAMMDAAEPEVVGALGYMAGVYTTRGMRADALFRSIGRLLCDLEAGELAALVKLLREVEKHDRGAEPLGFRGLHLSIGTINERDMRILTVGNSAFHIDEMPQGPRIFMLLKREGLGSSQPLPREVEHINRNIPPSGDRTMRILGTKAAEVLQIIDPQLATAPR